MKKLLILFLLIPSMSWGGWWLVSEQSVSGGVVCTVDNDSVLASQELTDADFEIDTSKWKGQGISSTSNMTITAIEMFGHQSAGSGNMQIALYTDSAGVPDTIISNTTVTVDYTLIGATNQWITFVLSQPYEYTANDDIHIVISSSAASSYYLNIYNSDVYSGGGYTHSSNGGTSFTTLAGYETVFRVYGCE